MSNTSRTSSQASLDMSSTDENWLPRPELHIYKDMCTSTTNANAKRSRGCFLVRAWTWLTARRNKTVTTVRRTETSSNSEICQWTLTQQEREEEQQTPRDTPTPWNLAADFCIPVDTLLNCVSSETDEDTIELPEFDLDTLMEDL